MKNPRQLALFDSGNVNMRQFNPVDFLREGALNYAKSKGYELDEDLAAHARVKGEDTWANAIAYDKAPDFDPKAIPHFDAMRRDLEDQYDYLTRPTDKGGLGVAVEVTDEDPYNDVYSLSDDLRDNRRIRVMSTESTGSHPYFTNEENDRFRAVHDAFGHAGTGRNFARDGEEGAYLHHAQMFSPEARPALEMETRGQNSYLNALGRGFGPQKIALLKHEEEKDIKQQRYNQGILF